MPGCNPPDSLGESFISDAGLAALETPASRTVVTSAQEIKTALPPNKAPMHSGRPFETPSAVRGLFLFEHTPISITPWSNIPRVKTLFSIDVTLTPSLAILTTRLPLLRFYTNFQSTPPLRSLRILERGHWKFPTRSFSTSGWDTFWKYLKDFISAGRASWGVWCVVEKSPNLDSRKGDDGNNVDRGKVCKVYCWGKSLRRFCYYCLWLAIARSKAVGRRGLMPVVRLLCRSSNNYIYCIESCSRPGTTEIRSLKIIGYYHRCVFTSIES